MLMTGAGAATAEAATRTAVFAGGCFWCMQSEFDDQKGVVKTVVGFTGGHLPKPTYEQVSAGGTGHFEAIEVLYDPAVVTYDRLLEIYWGNVDPLDATGQFCDQGAQYRSAIFVADPLERRAAEASKAALAKKLGAAVVTDILPRQTFWPAEEYHQEYYKKNPIRYRVYRSGCGRDARLGEVRKQLEKGAK
jgi:peptide-methionine (S)-S-oxide reductase